MKKLRSHLLPFIMALVAVFLVACAAPAPEAEEEEAAVEEEEVEGDGESAGTIIAFTPARSERYVNGLITGLTQEAENAGYDITILENEFNQAEQDEQVQQQLAIGAEPDIWIWWPAEGAAGLGSLRDLAATDIPVLQINQLPSEDAAEFVVGYAGPDDALRARNAGLMMVQARDEWVANGKELSSEGGNAIAVTYPVAYGGYSLSIEAFNEAIEGSDITVIGESNEGFGSQNGYNGASALIAQVEDQGIDFIYGMDDAILQGAIQALEEAGYAVGVPEDGEDADIIAVGTVCNGDRQLFEEARQYGTTLQAPLLEGQLAIQAADEYLTTGELTNELNFTPNPAVLYNEWEEFTLEGFDGETYTMDSLCTWGTADAGSAAPVEEEAEEEEAVEPGSAGEIIAFTPARSERYVNGLITGLSEEAAAAGYDITIFENEFNQAEQDEQVQQQLAIGAEPDIWIWWPAEGAAGLGSLRDLAATDIPVLQINQLPSEDAAEFVVGYAGPDDALRARNAGLMMVQARDEWVANGKELSSEDGNAIAVTYPVAYGGYPLSIEAFNEGIEGSGITVIGESNEGFGSQNGYNGAAALIAQVQDEGIDFIYGMDDAILQGAIQALEEAGFTMGTPDNPDADIIAVGTVCNGDRQLLEEGRQYGTTLQAPLLEGQLAIQSANEYLTTGELTNELNFTPNPAVLYNEWEDFTLEGFDGNTYTMDELCTWN